MYCGRKTSIIIVTCCTSGLLRKAFTIIAALLNTVSEGTFVAGMQTLRYFVFFSLLQAVNRFLSNITIVIEHDDNFDKSSLTFYVRYDR